MPRGTYLVNGRPEAFSCAPGPAGWRYVSDAVDLACDDDFGVVRFEVRVPGSADPHGDTGPGAPGSVGARGGRVSLDDGGRVLAWSAVAVGGRQRSSVAGAVLTDSPGCLVALLRQVAPPGGDPVRRLVPVVRFDPPALAGIEARRVLSRLGADVHAAPAGDLLLERWHVDDPDTGERVVVHLAGDVVVHAAGGSLQVDLEVLDSPPTGTVGPAPSGP